MKNYLLFYTVILLTLFPIVLFAQSTSPIRCAADEFHEEQMQDPDYAARFRTIERQVREQLGGRTPSCASPIIVPVAIHFSGAITSANMTCLQDVVDDQIDALNEDFGGYNTDIATYCNHASNCPGDYAPTALAGGTCVQFCLATMDHPVGSGLSNGESAFTFGQYTFDTGAGPWEGYMNIFVSNIPPAGYDSSLLGLAPLFGGATLTGMVYLLRRVPLGETPILVFPALRLIIVVPIILDERVRTKLAIILGCFIPSRAVAMEIISTIHRIKILRMAAHLPSIMLTVLLLPKILVEPRIFSLTTWITWLMDQCTCLPPIKRML